MQERTDAVLFDFGGVFTASPFGATEEFGRALGTDPARLLEIVFGPYDQDTDHPWHRVERGELDLVGARNEILALGEKEGVPADPFKVFERMATSGGARSDMVDRARSIRAAGIRTALVTNNVREFRDAWRRMVPVEELFEVVIDSSEVGVRKPDPRIFELALAQLGGIAPHHTVFLDDYPGNVEAAVRLGIRGILVEADPTAALASLDRILAGAR